MTFRRLFAIALIFLGSTVAWFALGSSVLVRTGQFDHQLGKEVALLWGGPHTQLAPEASVAYPRQLTETVHETKAGQVVSREVTKSVIDWAPAPLISTRADATLNLEHRRKGLLWYDTYDVTFGATYVFENPAEVDRRLRVKFAFPAEHAIYDDFVTTIDGIPARPSGDLSKELETFTWVAPRGRVTVAVSYRSRGTGEWKYAFSSSGVVDVRDFVLTLRTNFPAIDFPAGTMSPTEKTPTDAGWQLTWRFANLVTGQALGMDLPNRLNPGPLAARITYFAPVSLLFFLTVMIVLELLSGEQLHAMNYFFISAAFFSFHLLFAYLVDHISLHRAFFLAAAVSVGLVASYLRVVAGAGRRLWPAAVAQTIYLVAFSYAFFFEGLTGLAVTIGAVITLFVLMQITARVKWSDVYA